MNIIKRSSALVLALVLIVSVFSMTVFALDNEWNPEFRSFKMLSQGSPHTGYVYALQQFLHLFPASSHFIEDAGGIDGRFGAGTGNAVRAYQTVAKRDWDSTMAVDGIAGGDTWVTIAHYLAHSGNRFTYNNKNAMCYDKGVLRYYKYTALGPAFHTVSGISPEV